MEFCRCISPNMSWSNRVSIVFVAFLRPASWQYRRGDVTDCHMCMYTLATWLTSARRITPSAYAWSRISVPNGYTPLEKLYSKWIRNGTSRYVTNEVILAPTKAGETFPSNSPVDMPILGVSSIFSRVGRRRSNTSALLGGQWLMVTSLPLWQGVIAILDAKPEPTWSITRRAQSSLTALCAARIFFWTDPSV